MKRIIAVTSCLLISMSAMSVSAGSLLAVDEENEPEVTTLPLVGGLSADKIVGGVVVAALIAAVISSSSTSDTK
jgi:hypothetical protein